MCVCLSVCLSTRISPEPHSRFLQVLHVHVVYGRGSVLRQGDEIPRDWAILGVFFLIDNALYGIGFGTRTKTAESIKMLFGMMSGLGQRNSVLCGGWRSTKGKGQFLGKTCKTSLTLLWIVNWTGPYSGVHMIGAGVDCKHWTSVLSAAKAADSHSRWVKSDIYDCLVVITTNVVQFNLALLLSLWPLQWFYRNVPLNFANMCHWL